MIEVEHIGRSELLVVRKHNTEEKVELRLSIPTTEEGKVYFCALLGGIGDSIEIFD